MSVYTVSLIGVRPQNEDSHEIIINLTGKNTEIKQLNFFGIFDGHGHGHGGKQISTYIKNNLPKYFLDQRVVLPLSKRYVVNVYDHLQKNLIGTSFSKCAGSTGLVVLHYKHDNNYFLNVINNGDSRCVLCRDNFALPLTKDHKPNSPEEKNRITQLGGNIEFDGFDWRIKDLSVSRSFGDIDATPFVTHRPDLFRYKLDKNDKFIVLACDGLWDVLSNSDVVDFILLNCYDESLKNRTNVNINVAKKLANHAIEKGSGDNVTVIIVFF